MTDKGILDQLLAGDELAFEKVVKQYQLMVVRTAFGYLKNQDEAEDLAQEVFISVFENIQKFRGDANLKTWIFRITINKSINQLRKQKWKNALQRLENVFSQNGNEIADPTNPHKELLYKHQENAIDVALSKLPENQRTAFILHKYDELPQQEIAQIMNVSISAVESLVFRAKQRLQQLLIEFKNK